MHDGILPARSPDHGARLGERDRTKQRIDAADHPDGEEEPCGGEEACDFAGGAEDTDTDGVADQNGEAEGDTEDLVELGWGAQ